ncbi:hypothetical protein COJ01_14560 [Priestia megaterium]|uniref:hypothetical protein n=1 Tax=Priestia megaterium TaxID=1404 RepID=UPI000BF92D34|nr:hypothetical protein [Priestia megaterium]PFL00614.1 hypothetical protein COJ01_14560 [Priestia megaterium]
MKKRTKTIILVSIGAAILIGSIWGTNESRYPNVPAFNDHFTRKFLNKDKKVDDGFYEFKSKTGQYTMWFPEGYQIIHKDASDYVKDDTYYEFLKAANNSRDGYKGYIDIELSEKKTNKEKIYVEGLFKNRFYINDPQKLQTDTTRIYYDSAYIYFKGTDKRVITDFNKRTPSTYAGYIADKNSERVIEFYFDSTEHLSEKSAEEREEWIIKILKSITFKTE